MSAANLTGGSAGMATTAQLARGKTGAIVGSLPASSQASTPSAIQPANKADNRNFFDDSGN